LICFLAFINHPLPVVAEGHEEHEEIASGGQLLKSWTPAGPQDAFFALLRARGSWLNCF